MHKLQSLKGKISTFCYFFMRATRNLSYIKLNAKKASAVAVASYNALCALSNVIPRCDTNVFNL